MSSAVLYAEKLFGVVHMTVKTAKELVPHEDFRS